MYITQLGNQEAQPLSQIPLLHIPHSSRLVPAEDRQTILLGDAALNNELLRMTDAYTHELFPVTQVEAGRVIFPLSRLVCDVERFPSDEEEPMAARGMGVTYTRTSIGEVLRVNRIQRIVRGVWTSGTGRTTPVI